MSVFKSLIRFDKVEPFGQNQGTVLGKSGDGSMIELDFLHNIVTYPCQSANLPD